MSGEMKRERKDWFYSYNAIFDLEISIHAKMIYLFLCRCADENGSSFPSYNKIKEKCGISSRTTISKALKELEDIKIISIKNRIDEGGSKTSNIYTIFNSPPSTGDELPSTGDELPSSRDELPLVQEMNYPSSGDEHKGLPIEGLPNLRTNPLPPKGDFGFRDFDKFWKAYPKKKAKEPALKAFTKIKPDENLLNVMLKAIDKQIKSPDWVKDNGQFIPNPATWLNQKRWEDEEGMQINSRQSDVFYPSDYGGREKGS